MPALEVEASRMVVSASLRALLRTFPAGHADDTRIVRMAMISS